MKLLIVEEVNLLSYFLHQSTVRVEKMSKFFAVAWDFLPLSGLPVKV